MSGILSLARELLQIYRGPQIHKRSLFRNFVIIAFILSAAWLWIMEHQQLNATKAQLAEALDNSKPKMVGTIHQITMLDPGQSWRFLIALSVRNEGADSIAGAYYLTLACPNKSITVKAAELPDNFVIRGKNGKPLRVYNSSDSLFERTSTILHRGDRKFGLLLFEVKKSDFESGGFGLENTTATVTGMDYLDKEFSASQRLTKGHDVMQLFPGAQGKPPSK